MNKLQREIYQKDVSFLVRKGLTIQQASLVVKQTKPEYDMQENIYRYFNKDNKETYVIQRLGKCCGPWLSVSCRKLNKKGFIKFDFSDIIYVEYMGMKVEAHRVIFESVPNVIV
ncbi:hypothetical protein ZPAH1_orf00314 [Aeromonas phage ZPAH1]|nr:hypothetical protein ZPAH1_orf00314 [Aeromonas phage ZPAH1]